MSKPKMSMEEFRSRRYEFVLRGNDLPQTRLTEEAVKHIRSSSGSNRELADHYGVDITTIRAVRDFKTWRWVRD